MKKEQNDAYDEYLEITGEKDKRKKKRTQINIRLSDSDFEKLETLVSLAQESLKLSFQVGDSSVDLNKIIPASLQKLTPTLLARHFVREAINELLPEKGRDHRS